MLQIRKQTNVVMDPLIGLGAITLFHSLIITTQNIFTFPIYG